MQKKILLWFDVEDYVTPEAEDTLLDLLQLLDEFGIRATLKFCTQKYEQLIAHGRTDIIRLIANHELAFHMTNHSVHPLPSEYLDNMGFIQGAQDFDRRERDGYERLKTLSGQNLTSYGHPGVAWAPQVFPALRNWGIPTYLDVHDIVQINGQPFWYGGVLCYTKLNNLAHLDKSGSTGSLIAQFKKMNTNCVQTVFLSAYDHPHELCCTQFWDSVNFANGMNPAFLQPSTLRAPGEKERLLQEYRDYFTFLKTQANVEFVTAQEGMRYEHQRSEPISNEMLRQAIEKIGTEANYAQFGGAYCAPSEILNLLARSITGKMLIPELIYGPEKHEKSVTSGKISVQELAITVLQNTNRVMGYKQLPNLYRIGDQFINPEDAFATLATALQSGTSELEVVEGRLAAADQVDSTVQFGGGWDLWEKEFKALNIIEQTVQQSWTLKPAVF